MKKIIILIIQFSIIISLGTLNCNQKKKTSKTVKNNDKPIKPQNIYTSEHLGNWEGLEDEHLPKVKIFRNRKQNIVVHVPLKSPSQKHYIEKIVIAEIKLLKEKNQKTENSNDIDNNSNSDKKKPKDIKYKIKKILARKYFSRHAKYFEAIFSLHPIPKNKNTMILVKCNLHDMWMMPFNKAKQ